jgi:hypothetical protein
MHRLSGLSRLKVIPALLFATAATFALVPAGAANASGFVSIQNLDGKCIQPRHGRSISGLNHHPPRPRRVCRVDSAHPAPVVPGQVDALAAQRRTRHRTEAGPAQRHLRLPRRTG